MLNKNYIIIGVVIIGIVIVTIAAGAIFWSRGNSSAPDSAELERGVKNLTRESAADMIETSLKVDPRGGKTKRFNYDSQRGHYNLGGGFNDSSAEFQMIGKLEESGFVKIVEAKKTSYGISYESFTFDFTDKATPYFLKREGAAPDDKNVEVILGELVSVEVTGITEPAQGQRLANYTARFKATPIGAIIDEKSAAEDVESFEQFMLYDDGWRIGFGLGGN